MFNINVISLFEVIKQSLKIMKKNTKKKSILNISSFASKTGGFKISHYAASKSAVDNLTLSLSKELERYKVNIFSVAPYNINYKKYKIKNKNKINSSDLAKKIINIIKKNPSRISGKTIYLY